jgi:hypothetical protein
MKLPVSSRVAVSRIAGLAISLSLGGNLGAIPSAAATGGFGAADTQVENHPAARAPFVRGSLTAELIEPIRKVA